MSLLSQHAQDPMPASFIGIDQGRERRDFYDIAHAPDLCSEPLLHSWIL